MHEKNILHRDIKPENFLIGNNDENNLIYAIDFGISKSYKDPEDNTHIELTKNN